MLEEVAAAEPIGARATADVVRCAPLEVAAGPPPRLAGDDTLLGLLLGVAPAAPGRPTEFDRAVWLAVLSRHAEGETIRAICADEWMPAAATVRAWMIGDTALASEYDRAHTYHADSLVEQGTDLGRGAVTAAQQKVRGIDVAVRSLYKAASLAAPSRYGEGAKAGPGISITIKTSLDLGQGGSQVLDGNAAYQLEVPDGSNPLLSGPTDSGDASETP